MLLGLLSQVDRQNLKVRREVGSNEQAQIDEDRAENIPKTTRKYLIVLGVFQGVVLGIFSVTN